MNRLTIGLLLTGCLVAGEFAAANPHPLHDDGGAVDWKGSFAEALKTSQATGKPIFIDAGTKA